MNLVDKMESLQNTIKKNAFKQLRIQSRWTTVPTLANFPTVHYEFVVGEDGKLRDIKIVSSTDEEFSKELLRVLKRSPRWKPAMKDGKPKPYLIKNQRFNFNGPE